MNRAFLILAAPAALVVASFGGLAWGYRVSIPLGLAVLAAAAIAYVVQRRRDRPAPGG